MPSAIRSQDGVSRGGKEVVMIELDKIFEREGWNPRQEIDIEELENFKNWIRENGVDELPPIKVVIRNNRIELIAGHRRVRAVRELIAEGMPILGIRAENVGAKNEAELYALAMSENNGIPLPPHDKRLGYRNLLNWGWDVAKIAKSQGVATTTIYNALELLEADTELSTAVQEKEISATKAVKIVKKAKKTGVTQEALLAHHKATHTDGRKTRHHPGTAENHIRSMLIPLVEKYGYDQVEKVLQELPEFVGAD